MKHSICIAIITAHYSLLTSPKNELFYANEKERERKRRKGIIEIKLNQFQRRIAHEST